MLCIYISSILFSSIIIIRGFILWYLLHFISVVGLHFRCIHVMLRVNHDSMQIACRWWTCMLLWFTRKVQWKWSPTLCIPFPCVHRRLVSHTPVPHHVYFPMNRQTTSDQLDGEQPQRPLTEQKTLLRCYRLTAHTYHWTRESTNSTYPLRKLEKKHRECN